MERAMWRWVTWAISWASTPASSLSSSVASIRPVCTPMKPPGRANALMLGSSTTKNSKSCSPSLACATSRWPTASIYSVIWGSSTTVPRRLSSRMMARPMRASSDFGSMALAGLPMSGRSSAASRGPPLASIAASGASSSIVLAARAASLRRSANMECKTMAGILRSHYTPAARGGPSGSVSGRYDGARASGELPGRLQHFLGVALHLHLAPFPAQFALVVDQEGAALDTHHLAPVHVLLLDHVELAADLLLGIGQQVEGELVLGAEFLVGGDRVP